MRVGAWASVWLLIAVIMTFFAIRISSDIPNIVNNRIPPIGEFDRRYAEKPILAYLHIIPGVIYLLGAPFQLSSSIRRRSIRTHRRMGRVILPAGIIAGVMGVAVGVVMSWGGVVGALATVVFGTWFVFALSFAYRQIRAGNVTDHRRWMIRAFAVGVGVGTIRIWVGLFQATQLLDFDDAFGLAFWIGFALHALVAEAWLRWRPAPYAY